MALKTSVTQSGWDPLGTSGHVFNDQLMSG